MSKKTTYYRCKQLLILLAATTLPLAYGGGPPPIPTAIRIVSSENPATSSVPVKVSATVPAGVTNLPPGYFETVYITNTVHIIPSNTVIRIQVRDSLTSGEWYEPIVIKSRTPSKFFRILFETEADL